MKTINLIGLLIFSIALVSCGGGESSASSSPSPPVGFVQTYTASAGVGEVLQFSVDTTNMTYSYKVIQSSFSIPLGQTSAGALLSKNTAGSYSVGPSVDSFIQSGDVFPIQNGLLVGHVQISGLGGLTKIPVFGMSNPITTLAGLAGTFNHQGFYCGGNVHGNVLTGGFPCVTQYGTIKVDGLGNWTDCAGGNITATPSCSTSTGTIALTSTPGVYNSSINGGGHTSWFIAFIAPNGQKVAVIDHDDATNNIYGHSVATTQASMVAGSVNGNYFAKSNEGHSELLSVNFPDFTSTAQSGMTGTLTPDTPWTGMTTFQIGAVSGVAMVAGTGAYTSIPANYSPLFYIGLRSKPSGLIGY